LRPIRKIVDAALAALTAEFDKLYANFGRPSIAPEKLLRALLLQAFYPVWCPDRSAAPAEINASSGRSSHCGAALGSDGIWSSYEAVLGRG
jgi:hypothetical protein